jgi:hypothetical protein
LNTVSRVLPVKSETKFHTYAKIQAISTVIIFYCLCTMKLSTSPYIKSLTLTSHITTSTGFSLNLALELKQILT